jgi:hypothetical protein
MYAIATWLDLTGAHRVQRRTENINGNQQTPRREEKKKGEKSSRNPYFSRIKSLSNNQEQEKRKIGVVGYRCE